MTVFSTGANRYVRQDVSARLDYVEDYTDFMALAPSDSITTSQWTCADPDLTLNGAAVEGPLVSVFASGGVAGTNYRVRNHIVTAQGREETRYFYLSIVDGAEEPLKPLSTALFDRFSSVDEFKTASLAFLDKSFPIKNITDDYIWDKLMAAEAEAADRLRVLFQPTEVIPDDAPAAEVNALIAAGTAYVAEPPYDYSPQDWHTDAWGITQLRHYPVIEMHSIKLTYPSPTNTVLDVPLDWVRLDHKTGLVRFVPTGTVMNFGPISTYLMTAMASGRRIPSMMHFRYKAGLSNPAAKYPELLTVVKNMAVFSILKSAFLPQSGSISADGLSRSTSIDLDKWHDGIENDIKVLRQKIHGVMGWVL